MSAKSAASLSEKAQITEVRPFPVTKAPEAQALPAKGEQPVAPHPAIAPTPETPPPPAAPVAPKPVRVARKRPSIKAIVLPVLAIAVAAVATWQGHKYWTNGRFMISTDDAFVQADMAFVTPKITGYVMRKDAGANQHVKAGDPILTIDDGDYAIALAQTEAQIEVQKKTLDRIVAQTQAAHAALGQAQAQKTAAEAAARNAARVADRMTQLLQTRVATQAQVDDANTAVEQANAALLGADAQIASANANIGVLEAQHEEARAAMRNLELSRDKAQRDLSFTVLRAPYDGVVGNLAVEQGDLVSAGQKLAVVVPMDKLFIVANFKETQLGKLAPGEKVKFTVDAINDVEFEGTVSSLAPASGAVFSLLPAQNATGNYTKIVQRVPVRIDVSEEALKSGKLRAGLSVLVDVDSRTAPAVQQAK